MEVGLKRIQNFNNRSDHNGYLYISPLKNCIFSPNTDRWGFILCFKQILSIHMSTTSIIYFFMRKDFTSMQISS